MNRWHVYEFIKKCKGNVSLSEIKSEFKELNGLEVREGIIEYTLSDWFYVNK